MAGTLRNRIAGTVDDAKGRSKLAVGELIDNEDLKAAGRKDRTTGAVKQSVADAKDKLDDVVTKVSET
ncbi:MAG: CsbD-like [Thermomicrobiales bacterium]|nr:CsbD-like [Thermomicrobiales bacterium]